MITPDSLTKLKSNTSTAIPKEVSELFGHLFSMISSAHITHTYQKDKSLATHLALEEFYTELDELADELVECYQGIYGQVDFTTSGKRFEDCTTSIKQSYDYIDKNRTVFKESFLQNLVDEIQARHARTLFKLKLVQ